MVLTRVKYEHFASLVLLESTLLGYTKDLTCFTRAMCDNLDYHDWMSSFSFPRARQSTRFPFATWDIFDSFRQNRALLSHMQ